MRIIPAKCCYNCEHHTRKSGFCSQADGKVRRDNICELWKKRTERLRGFAAWQSTRKEDESGNISDI